MAAEDGTQEPVAWLPRGASSLEAGDVTLALGRDGKLNVFVRGLGYHLTITPGGASGVAEVHVTFDGTQDHDVVGAIRQEDVARCWEEIAPGVEEALGRIPRRRLRRSRLKQSQIVLVSRLLPDGEGLLSIAALKGRRLKLDKVLYQKSIELEDHFEWTAGQATSPRFLARPTGRRFRLFGLVCSGPDPSEVRWIHLRDLRQFVRQMERLLAAHGAKYLLPLEEFKRYWADSTRDSSRPALSWDVWRSAQRGPDRDPTARESK